MPLLAAFWLALASASAIAGARLSPADCGPRFKGLLSPPALAERRVPNDRIELLDAFARGAVPNLDDPALERAFTIYLETRFPATEALHIEKIPELADLLRKHPELRKFPFRPVRVRAGSIQYPPAPELDAPLKELAAARRRLIDPSEGRDYWRELLGDDEAVRELWASKAGRRWLDPAADLEKRYLKLAARLRKRNAPLRALVDLANAYAFEDPRLRKLLRDKDGMKRLGALVEALNRRDHFARELGYDQGYARLLAKAKVPGPRGARSEAELRALLDQVRTTLGERAESTPGRDFTVRPLSIAEAPFRSCLSGDCASDGPGFKTALEDRFHYFTLTDDDGRSSGHFAVLLGRAHDDRDWTPTANLFRVQGVADEDLPTALEAVRLALAHEGYALAVPRRFRGSNDDSTRILIEQRLPAYVDQSEVWTRFEPEAPGVALGELAERAETELKPLLPLADPSVRFELGESPPPIRFREGGRLDMDGIGEDLTKLKDGNPGQRLSYVELLPKLREHGIPIDRDFDAQLVRWATDPKQPLRLRFRILTHWLKEGDASAIDRNRAGLSHGEQATLVANWLQDENLRKPLMHAIPVATRMAQASYPTLKKVMDRFRAEHWRDPENFRDLLERAKDPAEPHADNLLRYAVESLGSRQIRLALDLLKPSIAREPARFESSIAELRRWRDVPAATSSMLRPASGDVVKEAPVVAAKRSVSWREGGKTIAETELLKSGGFDTLVASVAIDGRGDAWALSGGGKLFRLRDRKLHATIDLGREYPDYRAIYSLGNRRLALVRRDGVDFVTDGKLERAVEVEGPLSTVLLRAGPDAIVVAGKDGTVYRIAAGRVAWRGVADPSPRAMHLLPDGTLVVVSEDGTTAFDAEGRRIFQRALGDSGDATERP